MLFYVIYWRNRYPRMSVLWLQLESQKFMVNLIPIISFHQASIKLLTIICRLYFAKLIFIVWKISYQLNIKLIMYKTCIKHLHRFCLCLSQGSHCCKTISHRTTAISRRGCYQLEPAYALLAQNMWVFIPRETEGYGVELVRLSVRPPWHRVVCAGEFGMKKISES